MFLRTLEYLACPSCGKQNRETLAISIHQEIKGDIRWGAVHCTDCQIEFPIWDGVLIWVSDVESYISEHAHGIVSHVQPGKVSALYRDQISELAKETQATVHIDESLESDRVTALYWLGHYVSARELIQSQPQLSPHIKKMITDYWDQGPMQRLRSILSKKKIKGSLLELGCGSGGLVHTLGDQVSEYLGVDSSFQGIYRAREILVQKKNSYPAPGDLVHGALSAKPKAKLNPELPKSCDFIVMDLENDAFQKKDWDLVAAFNVIDMLKEPADLFRLQKKLLGNKGVAIQSSPYIWHPLTAKKLKPKPGESSPERILRLATQEGFKKTVIDERDIPWVFFKNVNQIELYNVHLMGVSLG